MKIISPCSIEALESRIAPAMLSLTDGVLVYTASAGVANVVTLNVSGTNISITDGAETITLSGDAGITLADGDHTATGLDSLVSAIAIDTGDGNDTVRIIGTTDHVTVSGSGTQTVFIGEENGIGGGNVRGIRNLVTLNGTGSGVDTLNIGASQGASMLTLTAGSAGAGNGDDYFGSQGRLSFSGFENIQVTAGAVSAVRVLSTGEGTITTIGVGFAAVMNIGHAGSMQEILGELVLVSSGALTLDNSADTTGRVVSISDTQVAGLAPAAIHFTRKSFGQFTVLGGLGNDTFTIDSLPSASLVEGPVNHPGGNNPDNIVIDAGGGDDSITLNASKSQVSLRGGSGGDVITVGNGDLSALSNIQPVLSGGGFWQFVSINVDGGGQSADRLVVDDSKVGHSSSYSISRDTLRGPGFGTVIYRGLGEMALHGAQGENHFAVSLDLGGTPPTIPLKLFGGSGDNQFTVQQEIGVLTTVDGGSGTDTLVIDRNGSVEDDIATGHEYVFTGTEIARDCVTIFSTASVENTTLTAGHGNDFIDARGSSVGLTINASGGDDIVYGSPFADILTGGPGVDTYIALGVSGDASISDEGVLIDEIRDVFLGGKFEIVKLSGDSGANRIFASEFSGSAIIDGGGGKDTVFGSEVLFIPKGIIFNDVDGDIVTLKTSKGHLGIDHLDFEFDAQGKLVPTTLNLLGDPQFKGASITLTAKPDGELGDDYFNFGFINAAGVDLASVTVDGDLGRLVVGDPNLSTPGLGKLTVQSIGAFGLSGRIGSNESEVGGKLGSLAIKGSFLAGTLFASNIGAITIGGDLSGMIESGKNIARLIVRGSVSSGGAAASEVIGAIKIGGNLTGTISAGWGSTFAPLSQAKSTVIKSLTVEGDVRNATILAGASSLADVFNADVSIGAITVRGDWVHSNLSAGVRVIVSALGATTDTLGVGKGDGFLGVAGGNPDIVARVASVTIQGQVSGSSDTSVDAFSFVAQQFGSFKIDKIKLPLSKNSDPPVTLGDTGGDVMVREVV